MIRKFKMQGIWIDPATRAITDLAYEGFTHRTICFAVGIGMGAVGYRLKRIGVSTAQVRSGMTLKAQERIQDVLKRHGIRYPRRRRTA